MSSYFDYEASPQFPRCAFYGRYSTKMQRPASMEDQERLCRDYAEQRGWQILDEHTRTSSVERSQRTFGSAR